MTECNSEKFLFVIRQYNADCPQTKYRGIGESASAEYIFIPRINEDVSQAGDRGAGGGTPARVKGGSLAQ